MDGQVKLWDLRSGKCIESRSVGVGVNSGDSCHRPDGAALSSAAPAVVSVALSQQQSMRRGGRGSSGLGFTGLDSNLQFQAWWKPLPADEFDFESTATDQARVAAAAFGELESETEVTGGLIGSTAKAVSVARINLSGALLSCGGASSAYIPPPWIHAGEDLSTAAIVQRHPGSISIKVWGSLN